MKGLNMESDKKIDLTHIKKIIKILLLPKITGSKVEY